MGSATVHRQSRVYFGAGATWEGESDALAGALLLLVLGGFTRAVTLADALGADRGGSLTSVTGAGTRAGTPATAELTPFAGAEGASAAEARNGTASTTAGGVSPEAIAATPPVRNASTPTNTLAASAAPPRTSHNTT